MRTIIILAAIVLAGCAGTPQQQAEQRVQREMGWNAALNTYVVELRKCAPVETEDCRITPDQAQIGKNAVLSYRALRTSCLVSGNCNVCAVAATVAQIASIVGSEPLTGLDAACSGNADLDAILDELHAAPAAITEE